MPRMSEAAVRTRIVPFKTSPFPYDGLNPKTDKPFFDTMVGTERGHTTPRGGIYLEGPAYSDRSVLLALSARFKPSRAVIVVFLHGNGAILDRDVVKRQRVVDQFIASKLDAALIAPQFAVDALDSSAGHFWDNGGFARFLAEAEDKLAAMSGRPHAAFSAMPIVLVAYSGGYYPASSILLRGGVGNRVAGVVLFDALYGELPIFRDWIARSRTRGFFFSAFGAFTKDKNIDFEAELEEQGIKVAQELPRRLRPGAVVFVAAGDVEHVDFVTNAWVENPLRAVLSRIAVRGP